MENILTTEPTNIISRTAPTEALSQAPALDNSDLTSLIAQASELPPPKEPVEHSEEEFDDEIYEGMRYSYDFTAVTEPPPGGFPEPLWDPFFLKQGLGVLYGPPDSGKSQFLRHLCVSIALGRPSHLGFPLHAEHHRAIYVITEDDTITHGQRMLQMVKSMNGDPTTIHDRLETIDAEMLPKTSLCSILHHKLKNRPADLIVIDAFSDVFTGRDMNSNTEVRQALAPYSKLAKVHNCYVMINHHPNKSGEKAAPDKTSVQGAGAFYSKGRGAFEIRGDTDGVTKYFSPVKGNHLTTEFKTLSYVMTYSEETGLFTMTGERIGKHAINQQQTDIDWAAIFEDKEKLRSGEIVQKLMEKYNLKTRAANAKLKQLPEGTYGFYRNPTIAYAKAA